MGTGDRCYCELQVCHVLSGSLSWVGIWVMFRHFSMFCMSRISEEACLWKLEERVSHAHAQLLIQTPGGCHALFSFRQGVSKDFVKSGEH